MSAESDMQLRLRPAEAADIPALTQLIAVSVQTLGAAYYSAVQIESALRHVFGVDSQLIADGTYYVVQQGGSYAGCGGWSRRRTLFGGDQMKPAAEDELLDPAREAARIRAFFVHPAWARKGIGRMLIGACEAAARTAGFTRLELMATLPGVPLYSAVGYESIEPYDVPLPEGLTLPCIRMVRSLHGG